MRRRHLLAALPVLSLASPLRAQTAPPALDRAAIARVEQYLNGLTSFRARFLQIAQNGGQATGVAWIVRPGRMRFDYDAPEPTLLVASSGQVLMYDRELRQPTIVPANSTPLGVLLRDPIRLSGDITVTATERRGGFLELRQWAVVDAQGRETRVTLYEIDTTTRADPRLFDFNRPGFLEEPAQQRR
jgi:outer membrane lipoprotein-sorting protein